MFEKEGKVVKVSAVGSVGEIYEHVVEGLASMEYRFEMNYFTSAQRFEAEEHSYILGCVCGARTRQTKVNNSGDIDGFKSEASLVC